MTSVPLRKIAHARAGDPEAAVADLTRARAHGFAQVRHLREDPDLASLRGHPRFQALVRDLEAATATPVD